MLQALELRSKNLEMKKLDFLRFQNVNGRCSQIIFVMVKCGTWINMASLTFGENIIFEVFIVDDVDVASRFGEHRITLNNLNIHYFKYFFTFDSYCTGQLMIKMSI